MKPQSVLLVSHGSSKAGGAEHVFLEAVTALRGADTSLMAVLPAPGPLFEDLARSGVEAYIVRLPWWALIPLKDRPWRFRGRVKMSYHILVAIVEAFRFLRRHQPSVVVTNTMTIPSFAIAARLARIRHVWMVQEFGERDHGLQFLLGYKHTVRLIGFLSKTVTCCSGAVEKGLRDVSPRMATRVVYYGIDSDELAYRPRRPGPLRAVLLGRFSEAKGQRLAIEALALARQEGADVSLALVGTSDAEQVAEMEQLASILGVEPYLECKPFTNEPQAVWLEADVALMCSRDEAFGRVTVEAMKASVPVCGANSGGTPEIVNHGVNGLLFQPGDSKSLAENLVLLSADETLRERLALGAAKTGARFNMAEYGSALRSALQLTP